MVYQKFFSGLIFLIASIQTQFAHAVCSVALGSSTTSTAGVAYEMGSCFSDAGWVPPVVDSLGKLYTNTTYDYQSVHYTANAFANGHGGVDLVGGAVNSRGVVITSGNDANGSQAYRFTDSKLVYALGAGVVTNRVDSNAVDNISQINIKHKATDGTEFIAIYGHTRGDDSLPIGSKVVKGQVIGHLVTWGAPTHLHLEFNTNTTTRLTSGVQKDSFGFFGGKKAGTVDPLAFLIAHPSYSSFDGAGSLIDPRDGGSCSAAGNDGCSHDYVKLQSHLPNDGSAGFYQVLGVPGVCEAVRLEESNPAAAVTGFTIEVRPWSGGGGSNSKYYSVSKLPAVIPLVFTDSWNLVGFQTVDPVAVGGRLVKASCLPVATLGADVMAVKGTPIRFSSDYFWGGSGSLIRHSDNQDHSETRLGYGRDRDVALLLGNKRSLSTFQVTKTTTCPKITFSTPISIEISWKSWNAFDWINAGTVTNGQTLSLPTGSYWWIVKVKSSATNSSGAKVTATCSS
jgi:hypothetical protein